MHARNAPEVSNLRISLGMERRPGTEYRRGCVLSDFSRVSAGARRAALARAHPPAAGYHNSPEDESRDRDSPDAAAGPRGGSL